ncbi:hypothetical protein C8Q76DRAFT_791469 [Earliella scabrosa]|nr:hypothetical protein C8Q76DRAFT_791469 [Earliella scabrosa]
MMESFLHLLIWFAVRFLPHNCHDVGQFVVRYFDDYMKDDGEYCCGVAKKAAMNVGMIWLSHGELTFLLPNTLNIPALVRSDSKHIHPINGLVKDFLELLQSHYTLHAETAINAPTIAPPHIPVSSADGSEQVVRTNQWFAELAKTAKEDEEMEKGGEKATSLTPAQRKEHEKNAAKLAQQKSILAMFVKHFTKEEARWPDNDKLPDQLNKKYRRLKDDAPASAGSKRVSMHDSQFDDSEAPLAKRRSRRGVDRSM